MIVRFGVEESGGVFVAWRFVVGTSRSVVEVSVLLGLVVDVVSYPYLSTHAIRRLRSPSGLCSHVIRCMYNMYNSI